MAKKKTWFSLIKRFFISDKNSRSDMDKRKRWIVRLLHAKEKPPPPREMLQWETSKEDANSLPIIVAKEDMEKIEFGENTQSNCRIGKEILESDIIPGKTSYQSKKAVQELAAIKIQAVFRGYLARKALQALRGVVKLQALIRGWAVRQQAINTLKCLQSIVNIQSEVCSKRRERTAAKGGVDSLEYEARDLSERDINIDLNSQKRWDDSILTREESKSLFLNKREASIRRERIKEYYLKHRKSAETERERASGRRRYWLEQWVDAQLFKRDDQQQQTNPRNKEEQLNRSKLGSKYSQKQSQQGNNVEISKRSFRHRRQRSVGDDSSITGSPSLPMYMASTESAKARSRSLSSPRHRPMSFDVCSEASPYKHKLLSPISSINSEMTSSSWVGNFISSQRSPCLKRMPVSVKSNVAVQDVRIRGIYCQNGTGYNTQADYEKRN